MRTSALTHQCYAKAGSEVHKNCNSSRFPSLAFEDMDRIFVRQGVADRLVIGAVLRGLELNAVDHQDFASQVELEMDRLPVVFTHILLEYQDGAAFIEPSDDPPAEVHIGDEVRVEPRHALLRAIDPKFTRHAVVDLRFTVGGDEVGVRHEAEAPRGTIRGINNAAIGIEK